MIIGLCGRKGAGKDTFALPLIDHKDFAKVSFAGPLKELVGLSFELPLELMEDRRVKDAKFKEPVFLTEQDADTILGLFPAPIRSSQEYDKLADVISGAEINSIRELLQFIGTDVFRNNYDKNIWTDLGKAAIQRWADRGVDVVITDIRFANEADIVQDLGGIIIRIDRDDDSDCDFHESEKIDFDVDDVIINDGSIESLQIKAEEYVDGCKRKN